MRARGARAPARRPSQSRHPSRTAAGADSRACPRCRRRRECVRATRAAASSDVREAPAAPRVRRFAGARSRRQPTRAPRRRTVAAPIAVDASGGPASMRSAGRCARPVGIWTVNTDPSSTRARHRNRAAMEPDQLVRQRQADARAFVRARPGALDAVESLEHARQLRLGNADAGIANVELHHCPALPQPRAGPPLRM